MEYASNGDLFNYINQNSYLEEKEAGQFFIQIIDAVEYIHKFNICHRYNMSDYNLIKQIYRDLKPENFLIGDKNKLKLIDFGLSNDYEHGGLLKSACGSPMYAAPEMILGNHYHGLPLDIWSSGIILYAMLCGYLPFEGEDNDTIYNRILEGDVEFPDAITDECKNLILKMLIGCRGLKRLLIAFIFHI